MNETVTFADVVHPAVAFSRGLPHDSLVLDLIDTRWFQRLRDISQTANTRLVYMFSEHSRFGHCVGVAYLAKLLLESLSERYETEMAPYLTAVSVAALLHDVGHLAPGSHTAYKTWFPEAGDVHEELGIRVISEDTEIVSILNSHSPTLLQEVVDILACRDTVPPWTWEIISGGGWNVDRGNWCIVDSVLAGVDYGRYNIPALLDAFQLTPDNHLAIRENRLDAMMHFAISRHAMYRQIYQHRVLMASDMLNSATAARARDLGDDLHFKDDTMSEVLRAKTPLELPLSTLFEMKESWWRYHLSRWEKEPDPILSDLSKRLLHRKLFKTVRILPNEDGDKLFTEAKDAVQQAGFNPKYYLHRFRVAHMHRGDSNQALLVARDDRTQIPLGEAEPLFQHLVQEAENPEREWLAMPQKAKEILGRVR